MIPAEEARVHLRNLEAARAARMNGGTPQEIRLEVTTARALCALPDPAASDELLGPLVMRGNRLVLGGHTGEGKTTMALAIARAIALGKEFHRLARRRRPGARHRRGAGPQDH